ncbi:MAG TPA: nucleotide exchange factor GrpE [Coleofasciculaceae cyanobacterium]
MMDEEKQPGNTSQQTDETAAVTQDDHEGESAEQEVDLTVENEQVQPTADEPTLEASTAPDGAESAAEATEELDADRASAALESLQQENEVLKAQLEELNQQCESFKTQSMRIAADFDNFRKRTAKEKEDLEQQIKRNTLSELLPVVDNFDRARAQIKPQTDGEMTIHKSYQGVYKQLVDCLKRLGVSPMRAEGQEFDPNLHEAVMREATNEYPEGVVIEQLMRGYFIGDRVLRHAMVKVAAPAEPVVTSEEGTPETTNS